MPELWYPQTYEAKKPPVFKVIPGYLYVIHLVGTDIFKIGITGNIKSRFSSIDNTVPMELALPYYKFFDDCAKIERHLHKLYSEKRHKREWFKLSAFDLDYIKSL